MDRRRILPIFFVVFTNILGAGVILPILPLYAEGQFGASALQATLLVSAFFAAQFVAAPILGKLSDQHGRRPLLIISQIGTVLSFILFVFAAPLGLTLDGAGLGLGIGGGLVMLYVARILDGITGGNITVAQAYITDISTDENRAQALGIISAAFGAGFIFGPAFGGFLSRYNVVAPFVGAAVITSVSVLLTTFYLQESLPPEDRAAAGDRAQPQIPLAGFLENRTILLILAMTFISTMAFSAMTSTFALFAERLTFADVPAEEVGLQVGLVLTFVGVVAVVTQAYLIGPLVKRLGERKLAIFGQFSIIIGFVSLIAFAESPLLVTLLSAPFAFGNGVSQPTLQALITRFADARTRGRLLGIFQSTNNIALIISPIWAGYLFDAISPRFPYIVAVPIVLVAAFLGWRLLGHSLPGPRATAAVAA